MTDLRSEPNPLSLQIPIPCCPTPSGQQINTEANRALASSWTRLRDFLLNFYFPFFSLLLGTLNRDSELSQGHISVVAPEITEFITAAEGEALPWKRRLQISAYGFLAPPPPLLPGVNKHFEITRGWPGGNAKGFDLWFLKHWRVFRSCWFWTARLKIVWERFVSSLTQSHVLITEGLPVTRKQENSTSFGGRNGGGNSEERGTQACIATEGGRGCLALFEPLLLHRAGMSGFGGKEIVFFAEKCFLAPTASLSSTRVIYLGETVKILRWVKETLPSVTVNKRVPSVQDTYEKITLDYVSLLPIW